MATEIESRRFEAEDGSRNRFTIIAERDVILALGIYPRVGPWRFRMEDEGVVNWDEQDGSYVIVSGNIRLTTTDPNEPKD